MNTTLNIIQIIVSLILIAVVLLTVRSNGFNQGADNLPTTKTKSEKTIFYILITMAVLFAVLSLAKLYFA